MEISNSTASKYSKLFELLSHPNTLVIADHILKYEKQISESELEKKTNVYKNEIEKICEELEDLEIISIEYEDNDEQIYERLHGNQASVLESILRALD